MSNEYFSQLINLLLFIFLLTIFILFYSKYYENKFKNL
jgi:hypothetical protein